MRDERGRHAVAGLPFPHAPEKRDPSVIPSRDLPKREAGIVEHRHLGRLPEKKEAKLSPVSFFWWIGREVDHDILGENQVMPQQLRTP